MPEHYRFHDGLTSTLVVKSVWWTTLISYHITNICYGANHQRLT